MNPDDPNPLLPEASTLLKAQPAVKPGLQTTEFWLTIMVALSAFLATIADVLPAEWAMIATALSAGLYSLSRGQSKAVSAVLLAFITLPGLGCASATLTPAEVSNLEIEAVNADVFADKVEAIESPSPEDWTQAVAWIGQQADYLEFLVVTVGGVTPTDLAAPLAGDPRYDRLGLFPVCALAQANSKVPAANGFGFDSGAGTHERGPVLLVHRDLGQRSIGCTQAAHVFDVAQGTQQAESCVERSRQAYGIGQKSDARCRPRSIPQVGGIRIEHPDVLLN